MTTLSAESGQGAGPVARKKGNKTASGPSAALLGAIIALAEGHGQIVKLEVSADQIFQIRFDDGARIDIAAPFCGAAAVSEFLVGPAGAVN